jgi:hypothetical protein
MMCINFPITVRLLQNNERGFPLISTITVVELRKLLQLRVAQWLEQRLKDLMRFDDPCVAGSIPSVGRGFFSDETI